MPNGFTTTPTAIRPRDSGRIATTNVTNEIVAALQSVGIGDGEGPARGPRSLLLKLGTPHESLAGVFQDGSPIDLAPKWDLASTAAGVQAVTDDTLMLRDTVPGDLLTIDVSELPGVHLGWYVNHNSGPADTDARDVYLIDRSGVYPYVITDVAPIASSPNRWKYTVRRARMKALPSATANDDAEIWEAVPDSPYETAYNLSEMGNDVDQVQRFGTSAKFLGVRNIVDVVFCRYVPYPKVGDEPAGVCLWFDRANQPVLDCGYEDI